MLKIKLLIGILVVVAVSYFVYSHQHSKALEETVQKTTEAAQTAKLQAQQKAAAELASHCASNTLPQVVIVSIRAQHLWACEGTKTVYDNPVITGMELYPADLTPTGTYKISGKLTAQYLKGSDATGSWDDYVNYWMPFLYNQYGAYGFHDLTASANGANGRDDSDFGNVDINQPYTAAKHGSHGCVEMPLAAMKWLYDWAPVDTTVSIVG